MRVSAAGASASSLAAAAAAGVDAGRDGAGATVRGDGWLLELAPGWSIRATVGGGYEVAPPTR